MTSDDDSSPTGGASDGDAGSGDAPTGSERRRPRPTRCWRRPSRTPVPAVGDSPRRPARCWSARRVRYRSADGDGDRVGDPRVRTAATTSIRRGGDSRTRGGGASKPARAAGCPASRRRAGVADADGVRCRDRPAGGRARLADQATRRVRAVALGRDSSVRTSRRTARRSRCGTGSSNWSAESTAWATQLRMLSRQILGDAAQGTRTRTWSGGSRCVVRGAVVEARPATCPGWARSPGHLRLTAAGSGPARPPGRPSVRGRTAATVPISGGQLTPRRDCRAYGVARA